MKKLIFLYGFMGSGKSTIGEKVANRLDLPFIDFDKYLENIISCPIANYFSEHGETSFRAIEAYAFKKFVEQCKRQQIVVALGGGTLLDKDSLDIAKKYGTIVFLDVPLLVILSRLMNSDKTNSRPLAKSPQELTKLYLERIEGYRKNCHESIVYEESETDKIFYKKVLNKIKTLKYENN